MKYLFKKKSTTLIVSIADLVGRFLFLLWRRPKTLTLNPERILVVRLDHLGDILYATAVPQLLKEHFGACRVTFLTSSAGAALLKHNPFVDDVLVYDAPWFARGRSKRGGLGFWGIVGQLRRRRFDLALSLRGDLRENFLVFAAGAGHRIGYGVTGGGFFLSRQLAYRQGPRAHQSRRTLDMVRALGISKEILSSRIYFSPEEEAELSARWQSKKMPANWTAIQLKAGAEAKEWPPARAQEFLRIYAEKLPRRPLVFIGDSLEGLEWLDQFLTANPALPWVNLIGQTSLRELFWLIRQSRSFVGPDSGPSHIAASFGVPTLFLYSGTNVFDEWRSLEECADFLRHPVECSPCHEVRCPVPGHPCMRGIEPKLVLRWLAEQPHEQ